MRFMIIRKADKSTEAGVMPSEALLAAMLKYNEELMKAGVMLQGEGLQPSSKGFRVSTRVASLRSSTVRSPKRRSSSPGSR